MSGQFAAEAIRVVLINSNMGHYSYPPLAESMGGLGLVLVGTWAAQLDVVSISYR